jgi:hypothetical protein
MERPITAWHYFLHVLLCERGSRRFSYAAEQPLTKALQRVDWLVVKRRDLAPDTPEYNDPGTTLVNLWPLLPRLSIFEYKSASKGYRAREIHRLIGYGFQYFSANEDTLATRDDLMLVLLVARR